MRLTLALAVLTALLLIGATVSAARAPDYPSLDGDGGGYYCDQYADGQRAYYGPALMVCHFAYHYGSGHYEPDNGWIWGCGYSRYACWHWHQL